MHASIFYRILNQQLQDLKIHFNDATPYAFDEKEYEASLNKIKMMTNHHLKRKGKCSTLLLNQLARHKCQLGERIGNTLEFYNTSEILNLIESIELNTNQGRILKNEPLKGLYHIHHNPTAGLGYGLVKNIIDFWFDKDGNILLKRQIIYDEIVAKYNNEHSAIVNQMHMTAIMRRQKLNGEWLIYLKHNNLNYYLCLATHEEEDASIYEHKIKPCYLEFPEIAF